MNKYYIVFAAMNNYCHHLDSMGHADGLGSWNKCLSSHKFPGNRTSMKNKINK